MNEIYSINDENIDRQSEKQLAYQTHVQTYGWQGMKYDGEVSGTTGEAKRLEGITIKLTGTQYSGDILYKTHVESYGWQDWKSNGQVSGTTGQAKRLEAIQIKLSGDISNYYDVYYRVHAQTFGWLGWAKNGESAGTAGYAYRLEAIEIKLVPKGQAAPGSTENCFYEKQLAYQTHVESYGWQGMKYDGEVSGTTGEAKRLEGITIKLTGTQYSGDILYKTHVESYGWQDWKSNGQVSGTTGQAKRLEAIQIKLSGDISNYYDVYYRVHAQTFGWLGWAKNGESAGTAGYAYRLEAIEIKLVPKGQAAPGSTENCFYEKQLSYQTHVESYGWQGMKYDGQLSGTTGQAKRIEAIKINLSGTQYSGDVLYRTNVESYGWQDWKSNGQVSGTTGQAKQLETIQIKLSGDISNYYDIYYRVHVSSYGWLGWAKNGESAGTAGYGYRLEAIEIQLVPKGQTAPGSTENCFYEKNIPVEPEEQPELPETTLHPIMGNSEVTVNQMVSYFKSKNPNYDTFSKYGTTYDGILASGGAATIESFCQMYYEEALMEGIKPEIAFAQAMLETGFLQYGGDVKPDQYNFAGMGATGNGVAGNSFDNVRMGIRAHIQHLKCYASTEPLNNDRVDPRWSESLRGKALYVEYLSIPNNPYGTGWAGDPNYAEKIINMVNQMRTK